MTTDIPLMAGRWATSLIHRDSPGRWRSGANSVERQRAPDLVRAILSGAHLKIGHDPDPIKLYMGTLKGHVCMTRLWKWT
jgi:hypothetical protein